MELENVKKLKAETERKMVDLINDFYSKTELYVKSIDYHFILDLTGKSVIAPFNLKLKVEL